MSSKLKKILGMILTAILVVMGLSIATPAEAKEPKVCLVTPEKVEIIEHDGSWVYETRWKKEIPAIEKVSHVETKFYRDIPGKEGVSKTWYRFFREQPGKDETFTTWYKWNKTVPTDVQEYRYSKIIPGTDGVKECKWKLKVDDYKTKYQYQKQVKGVVQKKEYSGWQNTGDTFDWEWWSGNSTKWSFDDTAVLDSGSHNAVQSEWTEGGKQFRKLTQAYQYVKNGNIQQVLTGSHWDYQWATESPGKDWVKTDDCRWKVEPVPDKKIWFPSEDGWTTEVKGVPWKLEADRKIPGPDDTVWYNDGDWTKDVLDSPWVKASEESRGNGDGVAAFTEYKTLDGVTLVKDEAAEFEQASFEGWTVLDSRVEEIVKPIPGYREYLGEGTNASQKLEDAVWRLESSVVGWNTLETREVVTVEPRDAYWVYYNPNGEPTLELSFENWTTKFPDGDEWIFVDDHFRWDEDYWEEKKVTPAVYNPCKENPSKETPETLAYTGPNDGMPLYLGGAAVLVILGLGLTRLRKSS